MLKPSGFSEPFLERTLERAVRSGRIILRGSEYNSIAASENDELDSTKQKLAEYYKKGRFTVPEVNEVAELFGLDVKTIKNLITSLTQNGELKSIGGKFYLHKDILQELNEFIRNHFSKNDEIDVAVLRDFTGCSRKYLIPIFEYLDANGFTKRQGDVRIAGPNL